MIVLSKRCIVASFVLSLFFTVAGTSMVIEGRKGGWAVSLFGLAMVIFSIASFLAARPKILNRPMIQQYPEPVILNGRRGQSLSLAIVSILIAAVFFTGVLKSSSTGGMILHAVLSFVFGVGAFLMLAATIKPIRLTINTEGLVLENVFHSSRWVWRDVQNFRAISAVKRGKRSIKIKQTIGFDDHNPRKAAQADRLRKLLGVTASIPNHFGVSDAELASALNAWRARALLEENR